MSLRNGIHHLIAVLYAISFGALLAWFVFGAVGRSGHYDGALTV